MVVGLEEERICHAARWVERHFVAEHGSTEHGHLGAAAAKSASPFVAVR